MVNVSVSVSGPPVPVFPLSLLTTVITAGPVNAGGGVNCSPAASAVLISASVPVNMRGVAGVPSPLTVNPAEFSSDRVPTVTVSVTMKSFAVPASGSITKILLPFVSDSTTGR
jgi:hypothetical protein